MPLQDDSHLVLQHESMKVVLDPRHGGAIREFHWRSRPILRPTQPGSGDNPMDMACFPMVPYANRIAAGQFNFDNHSVRLRPNWDRDPHPLHGEGWRSSWEVVHSDASSATLAFDGGGTEWPWRYAA